MNYEKAAVRIHQQRPEIAFCFLHRDPSGGVIGIGPITCCQVGVGDNAAGVGCVDKLTIPGIDTHMGNTAASIAAEKYQIAGL